MSIRSIRFDVVNTDVGGLFYISENKADCTVSFALLSAQTHFKEDDER